MTIQVAVTSFYKQGWVKTGIREKNMCFGTNCLVGDWAIVPEIKYVRAFLIRWSLAAQFVNDFAGAVIQFIEVLSLGYAHATARVASDAV